VLKVVIGFQNGEIGSIDEKSDSAANIPDCDENSGEKLRTGPRAGMTSRRRGAASRRDACERVA
jgi:hypothetical protein